MDERAAAFFDLDRTLMSGSSAMQFARAAQRNGMVTRGQIARWGVHHLRFRLQGSTDQSTDEVVARVKLFLSGVPELEIARMSPHLVGGILARIYPEMLAEVRRHQDAGRQAFIVSAAADGLVKLLAQVLLMDGGIGTRYRLDSEGRLTGELDGPLMYGEDKVPALEEFAREHDLDLDRCWAYSDSASDLPMLELVGTAVAVNPDEELAARALEAGWQIMRFERLGRRLAFGGAITAALATGGGMWLFSRRRSKRPRIARPFG